MWYLWTGKQCSLKLSLLFGGSGSAQRAVRNLQMNRVGFVGTAAAEICW